MKQIRRVVFWLLICSVVVVSVAYAQTTPKAVPDGLNLGSKDVLQLLIWIGTIVAAVWVLATRIGKIHGELATTNAVVMSKFEDQRSSFRSLSKDLDKASAERTVLRNEVGKIGERVTVVEITCKQQHKKTRREIEDDE